MPQYAVNGANANGRNVTILVDSDSVKNARAKARSMGITPVTVEVADAAKVAQKNLGQSISNPLGGVSADELSNMTRQLATLVKAHVPIVESLTALVEQIDSPKLKSILSTVRTQVNEGKSLGDGFSQFPKVFNRVYVNMVRAGESSGRLDAVLLRLADFGEAQVKLRNKVMGALLYPIIMTVVGFIIVGVILVKVVPQITRLFRDQKKALPLPTEILIAVSNFAQDYFFQVIIGVLVCALLFERYLRTDAGRARFDGSTLRLPIIGSLSRKLAVARFARTLGTLLQSGVPMLSALEITKNVVNNWVFEQLVESARTNVAEGRSLAYSIKQGGEFPPIVIHMVGVGEKTGELEGMLINVADTYDQQIETNLNALTGTLEPVMMIVMAVLVGFIVMAVLLPIFEMNNFG